MVVVIVVAVALRQLMLQVKDPGFILVEAYQKFRFVGPDLPAQLGANRSRGSCDHDHAVANMFADRFQIEIDRDAPQQIRKGNFSRLLQVDTARDQFRQGGDGPEGSVRLFTDSHQPPHLGRGRRWNRNQDFLDSFAADYFPERFDRAKHRHAQNPQPFLEWVVIDTTDHPIAGRRLLGFANDHLGGMPRAHQEQTFRGRVRPHRFRQHAGENAYPGQEHKGDQALQHINGQRKGLQSPPIAHDEEERQRTSENGFHDVHCIVDPSVAPPAVHEIEERHDDQANHNE